MTKNPPDEVTMKWCDKCGYTDTWIAPNHYPLIREWWKGYCNGTIHELIYANTGKVADR